MQAINNRDIRLFWLDSHKDRSIIYLGSVFLKRLSYDHGAKTGHALFHCLLPDGGQFARHCNVGWVDAIYGECTDLSYYQPELLILRLANLRGARHYVRNVTARAYSDVGLLYEAVIVDCDILWVSGTPLRFE